MRLEGLHHASSNGRTVRAHGPSRSASRGHSLRVVVCSPAESDALASRCADLRTHSRAGTDLQLAFLYRNRPRITEREAAELPEIKLRLSGLDTILSRVLLLSEPLPNQCQGCYGNAGRDLSDLAQMVTLDFKTMQLTLRQ